MEEEIQLLELAARCEAAEGPDRELDLSVDLACKGARRFPFGCAWGADYHFKNVQTTAEVLDQSHRAIADWFNVPTYTGSLDAAMTLVPEGWRISNLSQHDHPILRERGEWLCTLYRDGDLGTGKSTFDGRCDNAATPGLALVAASLRALASQQVQP